MDQHKRLERDGVGNAILCSEVNACILLNLLLSQPIAL